MVAILLILYRSVVAALISLVVSVTAIVVAMGVLTWLAGVVELNVIVQSIATMLGLGVSVDYSLIMIRRFIDELTSPDRGAALTNTMRTAGRTVAASGTTVAAALATLLIVDMPVIRSMAVAAIVVVVVAVLTCLVVLPAVLYLLGPRVAAWRVPWLPSTRERARRRWGRVARTIMARPVAALAITSAALLALAVPALGLQTGSGDASVLPKSSSVREGYDLVEEQYGKGAVEPILVVIEADQPFSGTDDFARLAAMTTGFSQLDHVARVASPVSVLQAVMPADPFAALEPANFQRSAGGFQDDRSIGSSPLTAKRSPSTYSRTSVPATPTSKHSWSRFALSRRATLHRAGKYRSAVWPPSYSLPPNSISDATPLVIATMLAVIYLLLVLTFRSLLLPCKAIALNLLSVGAAIGAVVLVFQHGFLADCWGLHQLGRYRTSYPFCSSLCCSASAPITRCSC